jgi:co-chaperonin GroES (HSP10)
MLTQQEEYSLRELATKQYLEAGIHVMPLFPKILVRLVPKSFVTKGGIVLPGDREQNKPTHEGVVLETYKPFKQKVRSKMEDWYCTRSEEVLLDEDGKYIEIQQTCEVQPGDHVLFPYMAPNITPVWPLDEGKGNYRLIEEGHVLGKIEYSRHTDEVWLKALLLDAFEKEEAQGNGFRGVDSLVRTILQNADVIRKDYISKTTSGK